jgi:hypothetical protein
LKKREKKKREKKGIEFFFSLSLKNILKEKEKKAKKMCFGL